MSAAYFVVETSGTALPHVDPADPVLRRDSSLDQAFSVGLPSSLAMLWDPAGSRPARQPRLEGSRLVAPVGEFAKWGDGITGGSDGPPTSRRTGVQRRSVAGRTLQRLPGRPQRIPGHRAQPAPPRRPRRLHHHGLTHGDHHHPRPARQPTSGPRPPAAHRRTQRHTSNHARRPLTYQLDPK